MIEVRRQLRHRLRGSPDSTIDLYDDYLRIGTAFDRDVRDHLRHQKLDQSRDAFFCFNGAANLCLDLCAQRGIPSVLDQIDAGPFEEKVVHDECRRWEGWEALSGRIPEQVWVNLRREWKSATRILVNSNWSRQALLQEGASEDKIVVIPLAYEPTVSTAVTPIRRSGPLRILWLGTVCLRKGIPYLFEAARMLGNRQIEFTVTGKLQITEWALRSAPPNVRFTGSIILDQIGQAYSNADLFVLPTISDGFALTQLEAMAHGLPVIATPNCGEVVSDGTDGFIVPARNGQALADAIVRLDEDRTLLESMSHAALAKSRTFTIDRYGRSVQDALARFRASQGRRELPRGTT